MLHVEVPQVTPVKGLYLGIVARQQAFVVAQFYTVAQVASLDLVPAAVRLLYPSLHPFQARRVCSSASMPPVEEPAVAPARDRSLATAAHKQDSVEAQSNTAAQGANLASGPAVVLISVQMLPVGEQPVIPARGHPLVIAVPLPAFVDLLQPTVAQAVSPPLAHVQAFCQHLHYLSQYQLSFQALFQASVQASFQG